MYKVLISDNLSKEGQAVLANDPEIDLDAREKVTAEELLKIIPEYDALIIRSASKVTKEVLEAGKKLKVIGRAGVGIDNIDIPEATRRGIIVMNTPDANTISTAEHTFSMMMALSRNITKADASMKEGKWERKNFMGSEVYGKILGVIGLGRIGTELAKRAQAFGMTVIAFDPFLTEEKAQHLNVLLADVDEIFAKSDYISVHTPKNKETEGMINKSAFEKMKKSCRVINCARGGIINQDDLKDALRNGTIAGAALDVYNEEPPTDTDLAAVPNLILTPHLGASTEEAQINVGIIMAEQVSDALKGGLIRNAVNIPSVPPEVLKEISPYLALAEKLGLFQAQMMDGQLKKVTVEFAGDVCSFPTDLIAVSAVKGLLSHILSEPLNFVNTRVVAKDRGIEIIETTKKEAVDFTSTITIKVETSNEVEEISGTVIGNKREPYVINLAGYNTNFVPEGYLLFYVHRDEPGIVGRMGSILGNENVNIAALHMGRDKVGGEAVSILNVDTDVPKSLLDKLAETGKISKIKLVKL